jgi:hypothetical protein
MRGGEGNNKRCNRWFSNLQLQYARLHTTTTTTTTASDDQYCYIICMYVCMYVYATILETKTATAASRVDQAGREAGTQH